jgi:hypothetical protein
MCIYLFYQARKWRNNRDAPNAHARSEEATQDKQELLCEHMLASAPRAHDDGLFGSTSPGPQPQQSSSHCPQCKADKKQAKIYRWKVIISLLIPNVMASMDLTIIATALPTIASHFCTSGTHRASQVAAC